jgi:hypothetical protein
MMTRGTLKSAHAFFERLDEGYPCADNQPFVKPARRRPLVRQAHRRIKLQKKPVR